MVNIGFNLQVYTGRALASATMAAALFDWFFGRSQSSKCIPQYEQSI